MKILLCGAILGASLAGQVGAATPAAAVSAFYDWRIRSGASGAPNPAAQGQIKPLVTTELHCLLRAAWRLMEAYSDKYPENKPPYVEGDLYSSSYEGPTSFEITRVSVIRKTRAVAQVRLTYEDKDHPSHPSNRPYDESELFHFPDDMAGPFHWRDNVQLQLENGVWKVADFEYKGGFAFGNSGSLLAGLYANLLKPVSDIGFKGAKTCRTLGRKAKSE